MREAVAGGTRPRGLSDEAVADRCESRPDSDSGRFFRGIDWSAFWVAALVTFGVYGWTLAPTVTLEDSGELATAGAFLGVPHPPGYPIWTVLVWLFSKIFGFVQFRGQPNPAWSINLASAVFGALASGITALFICRSGRDILSSMKSLTDVVGTATEGMVCWAGGIACSLLFAFDPVVWSQSVIAEVYSLNALFLSLVVLLAYMWMRRPRDTGLLCWVAFAYGVSLTNHQTLFLLSLSLAVVIMVTDLALFRDLLILGAPYILVIGLIRAELLPPIVHPTDVTCFVYLALDVLALFLAFFWLPRGKEVALAVLSFHLGLAVYAYMPVSSEFNPPMNWGYSRTWEGFKHAVTRGQYEKVVPMDAFSERFLQQVGAYLSDLRAQFTLPVAVLGFLPFATWRVRLGNFRFNATFASIALAVAASALTLIEEIIMPTNVESPALSALYRILIAGVVLMLVVGWLALIWAEVYELLAKLRKGSGTPYSQRAVAAIVLAAGVGFVAFCVYNILKRVAGPGSNLPLNEVSGRVALVLCPLALAALVGWLSFGSRRLTMEMTRVSQKWILATVFAFLALGVVLVMLASPKGDVQEYFIQRVLFIPSHGIYALWIGYGIIVGWSEVVALMRGNRLVKWAGMGATMLLPAIPILQNQFNEVLIRVSGGAEQNRRDFGWQFGNYQLRGADAISEELDPDEEPVPNPAFPLEMGTNAIFFGGTDPGRFVPTYMIYSARVREDVYLITQNALADNTYMNVMRDLYGDRIWIPAQPDSARAFQRYVEEVRSGKRPKNAQLTIENGRVQVSGALGVMEINGILAEAIFEHNKFRHDFYVEESYVIQWMYPYLTPHGLIMKINRDPTPLSGEVVRDDMDFWDWYVRRLIDDPRFRRDVVARKSFSKLRSAIGGLYRSRGRFREAERAFQQARILYPLSPEANFRLVQEVFMSERRFGEARELMQEFGAQDPGNVKVPEFLDQLGKLETLDKRMMDLEAKMGKGALDVNEAIDLLQIYQQSGQIPRFASLASSLLQNTNLPSVYLYRLAYLCSSAKRTTEMGKALDLCMANMPTNAPAGIYLDMAKLYAGVHNAGKMTECLVRYLRVKPSDWKAWLDLTTMQMVLNRDDEASASLEQAVRYGGPEAMETIRQDDRFKPIRDRVFKRARNLMGFPGFKTAPEDPF